MANIMERVSADNITTFTARIRIKGYRHQTATFSRIKDARLWVQKTESLIREGKYFSQAEAKRHTFAEMTERYIKTVLPNKSAKVESQYAQHSCASGACGLVNYLLQKFLSNVDEYQLNQVTPKILKF